MTTFENKKGNDAIFSETPAAVLEAARASFPQLSSSSRQEGGQQKKKTTGNDGSSSSDEEDPFGVRFFRQMRETFIGQLSEEDVERYQKFGEAFYESFNMETGSPFEMGVDNTGSSGDGAVPLEESLAYVVESLKAGLHPAYLSVEEQTLVQACYGEEWYRRFGFESLTL